MGVTLLGHLAGHGEERERGALMGIFWRKRYFGRDILRICWKEKKERKKKKEKGEEIIKREDIFSNLKN